MCSLSNKHNRIIVRDVQWKRLTEILASMQTVSTNRGGGALAGELIPEIHHVGDFAQLYVLSEFCQQIFLCLGMDAFQVLFANAALQHRLCQV